MDSIDIFDDIKVEFDFVIVVYRVAFQFFFFVLVDDFKVGNDFGVGMFGNRFYIYYMVLMFVRNEDVVGFYFVYIYFSC